ncbi:MAG TPA: tetratricopeptide repeat protein, partial [Burkholderiales bacterium]|nr:tetratricopeptide repeat protein [Burkholderiales bacterium]
PNVLRAACEIRNRRLATDRARLMRLARELRSLAPAEQGLGYAALGLLCCAFGDLKGALDCYRGASATLGGQSQLALEVARLLLAAGRANEAVEFLTLALDDDKDRSAAHGYLAFILSRQGRLQAARSELEQAHHAAPCWDEPLKGLVQLHRQLGEHALADDYAARLAALGVQQEALRRQLGMS